MFSLVNCSSDKNRERERGCRKQGNNESAWDRGAPGSPPIKAGSSFEDMQPKQMQILSLSFYPHHTWKEKCSDRKQRTMTLIQHPQKQKEGIQNLENGEKSLGKTEGNQEDKTGFHKTFLLSPDWVFLFCPSIQVWKRCTFCIESCLTSAKTVTARYVRGIFTSSNATAMNDLDQWWDIFGHLPPSTLKCWKR